MVVNRGVHGSCNGFSCHIRCNKKNLSQSPQLVSFFCNDKLTITLCTVNIPQTITFLQAIVFIESFKEKFPLTGRHFQGIHVHGVSFFPYVSCQCFLLVTPHIRIQSAEQLKLHRQKGGLQKLLCLTDKVSFVCISF